MDYFKEISPSEFPEVDKSLYPDYYVEGCELRIDRLFRYKDCYIEVFVDENGVACMAIINFGEAFNLLCVREVVDKVVQEHGTAAFSWVKGIPNEVLIKRLLKRYDITYAESCGGYEYAEFKMRGEIG